ncbi:MAG TPA: cyclase family protein [Blastocatellia bacterium]|jgi:kynurenine formamidase|nr:cyclase family protein [Blastocatellia bacterium]
MKKRSLEAVVAILLIACPQSATSARPQKKQEAARFINQMKSARVIELNFIWDRNSPLLGLNPPFTIGLQTSHKQTKGIIPGGIAFAADMMFFSGQHGSPNVDALGHISDDQKLFGGADAPSSEAATGLLALGIEAYPKERFINRGVLLDVARFKNVDALAPGQEITAEDLEATAKAEGVEIQAGDSVLIRTGYGKFFEADRAKYSGFRPGPGEGAARWLAGKKIFLTGDDQMSYEVVPEKGTVFPCHRILIADSGIYLVENLNLEELSKALADRKTYEFVLVLNPPRIRGATGAAANAFAILPQ